MLCLEPRDRATGQVSAFPAQSIYLAHDPHAIINSYIAKTQANYNAGSQAGLRL